MQKQLPEMGVKLIYVITFYYALLREFYRAATRNLRKIWVRQRHKVINTLAERDSTLSSPTRVLVAIAHITSFEEAINEVKATVKVDRLKRTIDGLMSSFSHCQLHIIVCTQPGRHVVSFLPKYQTEHIELKEYENCDPMFIGFRAQDELVNHADQFDWFAFLEDDIVLHDSCFLNKLEKFNQACRGVNSVLLPNRYEFWEGSKYYIDFTIQSQGFDVSWNRLSIVDIENIKFAEFTNPHSGIYCLSKSQMQVWIRSGRTWQDENVHAGSRESAATFCLLECFSLYKPHPANVYFLEVLHYDTKYSKLCHQKSPYVLSAVSPLKLST